MYAIQFATFTLPAVGGMEVRTVGRLSAPDPHAARAQAAPRPAAPVPVYRRKSLRVKRRWVIPRIQAASDGVTGRWGGVVRRAFGIAPPPTPRAEPMPGPRTCALAATGGGCAPPGPGRPRIRGSGRTR